mmetsp:Transcript_13387/g.31417  ORF Transcript_13387/g.31417 Transcript_13387/m.31417 type:complete len:211 (+) Transcript_13387:159-791(+)
MNWLGSRKYCHCQQPCQLHAKMCILMILGEIGHLPSNSACKSSAPASGLPLAIGAALAVPPARRTSIISTAPPAAIAMPSAPAPASLQWSTLAALLLFRVSSFAHRLIRSFLSLWLCVGMLHLEDHAFQTPACDLLHGFSGIPRVVKLYKRNPPCSQWHLNVNNMAKLAKLLLQVCLLDIRSHTRDKEACAPRRCSCFGTGRHGVEGHSG